MVFKQPRHQLSMETLSWCSSRIINHHWLGVVVQLLAFPSCPCNWRLDPQVPFDRNDHIVKNDTALYPMHRNLEIFLCFNLKSKFSKWLEAPLQSSECMFNANSNLHAQFLLIFNDNSTYFWQVFIIQVFGSQQPPASGLKWYNTPSLCWICAIRPDPMILWDQLARIFCHLGTLECISVVHTPRVS
jgi:hypothetical protein